MKIDVKKGWSSHLGVLLRVIAKAEGTVVEFGAGPGSTPVLHWVCRAKGVKLITYESVPFYYMFAKQYQSRNHLVRFVDAWANVTLRKRCGVLFMDQGPAHVRGLDAMRLRHAADYIVLHDTQPHHEKHVVHHRKRNPDFTGTDMYNYDPMWPMFPYVYTCTDVHPWVSVVSMTHDCSWLDKSVWP